MIYKQVFVSGRVQGVFFRDSTWQKASELQLRGGVRNLHDGRVEVLVGGDSSGVDELIKWLKIGPKYAKVTTIEVVALAEGCSDIEQSDAFRIWPSR